MLVDPELGGSAPPAVITEQEITLSGVISIGVLVLTTKVNRNLMA